MSVTEQAQPCYVADCDGCNDPLGDVELFAHAHFEDKAEAFEYARDREWTVEGEQLFCEQCAAQLTCERRGHDLTKEPDGGYVCERCEEMWDHHPGANLSVVDP